MEGTKYSPTLQINELSKQLVAKGKTVYQLGFGQSPFPVPRVVVEALKTHAHQKDYLPVMGLPDLSNAVAQYYKQQFKFNATADQILIGPGSKELIFLCQMVRDWHCNLHLYRCRFIF